MGWSTMKEWSGSEVLTSNDMNTYVGSNIDYLYDNMLTANVDIFGTIGSTRNNMRMETGQFWQAVTTAAGGSQTISFETAFSAPPRLAITPAASYAAPKGAGYSSVGTGNFTIQVWLNSGTMTGTMTADWLAVGY